MINMTAPDLEKLIQTSMSQVEDIQLWMQRKVLEVILELHAWTDVKDVGTTKWIAKGDVNRKKVCRAVAVMSTATAITTATVKKVFLGVLFGIHPGNLDSPDRNK